MIQIKAITAAFVIFIISSCRHGKDGEALKQAFSGGGSIDEILYKMAEKSEPVYDVAILVDTAIAPANVWLDSLYLNGYSYHKVSAVQLEEAKSKDQTIKIGENRYRLLYTNLVSDYTTFRQIVDGDGVIVYDVPEDPVKDLPLNNMRSIKFGGGGIVTGIKPNQVLKEMKIEPQFSYPPEFNLTWEQYRFNGIDYFVIENNTDDELTFNAGFKTLAGAPEMWDPAKLEYYAIEDYWQIKGMVTFDVQLAAGQTLIYVFGTNADRDEMKEYRL